MIKILLLLLIFFGILNTGFSQSKNINHQNQQWLQYANTAKISKNLALKTDGGFRWLNQFQRPSLYWVRGMAEYHLDSNRLSFGLGIASFNIYSLDKIARAEIRPYQEVTLHNKFRKIKVQHRYRLEERFFHTKATNESNFNFRMRYRFFATLPLLKLSKTKKDCLLSLNIGDELFLNAGKEIVYNVFSENRLLMGPLIRWNKNLGISLLYSYSFQGNNRAESYTTNDVFWLSFNQFIDFTREKK